MSRCKRTNGTISSSVVGELMSVVISDDQGSTVVSTIAIIHCFSVEVVLSVCFLLPIKEERCEGTNPGGFSEWRWNVEAGGLQCG